MKLTTVKDLITDLTRIQLWDTEIGFLDINILKHLLCIPNIVFVVVLTLLLSILNVTIVTLIVLIIIIRDLVGKCDWN